MTVTTGGAMEKLVRNLGLLQCCVVNFTARNKRFIIFGMNDEGRWCLVVDGKCG